MKKLYQKIIRFFTTPRDNYIKYKIWNYRFFLKVLRDAKKDKTLDESLHRICCITPKFHKDFFNYYSRKHKRICRNEFKELNSMVRQIKVK